MVRAVILRYKTSRNLQNSQSYPPKTEGVRESIKIREITLQTAVHELPDQKKTALYIRLSFFKPTGILIQCPAMVVGQHSGRIRKLVHTGASKQQKTITLPPDYNSEHKIIVIRQGKGSPVIRITCLYSLSDSTRRLAHHHFAGHFRLA